MGPAALALEDPENATEHKNQAPTMTPVSGVIFSILIAFGVHLTTFDTNLSRIFAASQDWSWLHGPWKGAEGKLMKLSRKSIKLTIKIAISQSGITPLLRSFLRLRRLLRSGRGDPPATASLVPTPTPLPTPGGPGAPPAKPVKHAPGAPGRAEIPAAGPAPPLAGAGPGGAAAGPPA